MTPVTRENTGNEIRRIIGECFDVPIETVRDKTMATQIFGWDSLAHTILLMKVEEHFTIDLPLDDIYRIKNVGELIDIVQAVLVAKGP